MTPHADPVLRAATKKRHVDKRYRERSALILAAKDKPCTDCRIELPPKVMQLDHVRGTKLFAITKGIHSRSLQALIDEIAKCDVRCPNCHAMRHYLEREG